MLAGCCLALAVALWWRWRAPAAGRADLGGWANRTTQSAAIQFLDPVLVLPSARLVRAPVSGLGVLGRSPFFVSWLLLAVTAVFA